MADVVVVPGQVRAVRPYKVVAGYCASGPIVAGQVCYYFQDGPNLSGIAGLGRSWDLASALADPDPSRSGVDGCGIALCSAAKNQPVTLLVRGSVVLGTNTLVAGQLYYLSETEGGICPLTDLATHDYRTLIGDAVNTSTLRTPKDGVFASGTEG